VGGDMTEDYYLTYEYENRLKKAKVFYYQPVATLGVSSLNVGVLYSVPSYIEEWNFAYDANGMRIKKGIYLSVWDDGDAPLNHNNLPLR